MTTKKQQQYNGIIRAAGGIVWKVDEGTRYVALVHRPQYDDWTLPKGKLKSRESWQDAAKREVEEEIQAVVEIGDFVGCHCYSISGIPKVVLFWQMSLLKEDKFNPNEEIDQVQWLSVEDALGFLDYDQERRLLQQAADYSR